MSPPCFAQPFPSAGSDLCGACACARAPASMAPAVSCGTTNPIPAVFVSMFCLFSPCVRIVILFPCSFPRAAVRNAPAAYLNILSAAFADLMIGWHMSESKAAASKPRRASSISKPWRSVLTLPYSSSSNCNHNAREGVSGNQTLSWFSCAVRTSTHPRLSACTASHSPGSNPAKQAILLIACFGGIRSVCLLFRQDSILHCVDCILQNGILHLNATFFFAQLRVGTLAPLAPTPHPSSVRFLVLLFTLGDQWYIPLQRGRNFGEGAAHHAHVVCGL